MIDWNLLIAAIVLIASATLHELSHGYSAFYLGDMTAKKQGRLTFNPLKHIDLLGSIIVPGILIITRFGFMFAWAKPIMFKIGNFKDQRWGAALVGLAGPLSNILIAIFFGILIRYAPLLGLHSPFIFGVFSMIIMLNIVLAIFNLVPLPPFDGHHILYAILGNHGKKIQIFLSRYSLIIVALVIFMMSKGMGPVTDFFFQLVVGA